MGNNNFVVIAHLLETIPHIAKPLTSQTNGEGG